MKYFSRPRGGAAPLAAAAARRATGASGEERSLVVVMVEPPTTLAVRGGGAVVDAGVLFAAVLVGCATAAGAIARRESVALFILRARRDGFQNTIGYGAKCRFRFRSLWSLNLVSLRS